MTSFEQDPPNVALVAQDLDGAMFTTVAVMSQPKVTATGTFTARLRVLSMEQVMDIDAPLLAGHIPRHKTTLPQRFTTAAVFIDDFNGYWNGPSNPYNED